MILVTKKEGGYLGSLRVHWVRSPRGGRQLRLKRHGRAIYLGNLSRKRLLALLQANP